jgi:hypothetical protein
MVAINREQKIAVCFRPRCKTWQCPACAEINRRRWVVRAYKGAEHLMQDGRQFDMLTLTSHPRLSAEQTVWVFRRAWPKLRKRAQRSAPGMHYFMIPEKHADGRLHIHALTDAGLPTRFWKDNGAQCGLGFMNEEAPARDAARAAFYAAKYLSKQLQGETWPKGFRRVRTSQNWPTLPKLAPPAGWEFRVLLTDADAEGMLDHLERLFYTPIFVDHAVAWEILGLD